MSPPRLRVLVTPEDDPGAPSRTYLLPWYAKLAALAGGFLLAAVFALLCVLLVYYYMEAREVQALREQVKATASAVAKMEDLQRELDYHRDFTRRVAELMGISVPVFADSVASERGAENRPLSIDSFFLDEQTDEPIGLTPTGLLVSETPPDPNNRPRGLPLRGRVSRGFAPLDINPSLRHTGIDLAAREGTPVMATADGTVEFAGEHDHFGFLIVLDHGKGFKTSYGHNSVLLVETGQKVNRGDRIAYSGNTGISSAPHLHYEVSENGVPMDPAGFLGM